MLQSIQIARAIAVIGVLFAHLEWVRNDVQASVPFGDGWLLMGHGVDLFFCISGFIIAHLLHEKQMSPREFLTRRIVRIYPLYWVFTLSYVLAVSAACRFGERDNCSRGLDPTDIASSLLILPQEGEPVLSVGWSLEHEIIFYAIAALVCVALHMPVVRLLQAVTLLGCVGVIVHVVIPSITGDPVWDYHLFSLYHFQFAAGIAVFMMKDRLADANPLLMFALGVLAFVMTGIGTAWIVGAGSKVDIEVHRAGLSGLVSVLGYAISSVAFLSGLLGAEARGLLSGGTTLQALTVKALVLIGSASYALYLEHPLAYGVIGKVDRALHLGVASLIPALGVAFGATLIAGIVWFVSIERPFLRAAHRALAPRPLRLGA